ncbi:MAG: type II toxin-antitoxin system prevent-host-death family antitoxin, partial [Limnohabitans sp.]|nr:type II toxin-antitoxin system prevent-host-death family antitoxin [Limnohabitans sp.]
MVTKRGAETAVLVPLNEWRRLQNAERPRLKQLLLQGDVRTAQLVPPRPRAMRRKASSLA